MNLLKKVSLSTLMFLTVFGTGFVGFAPQAHAALMTGDLVKGPNSDAVYYIDSSSMKHVFPDKKTYMTWYSNFDAVKKVTVADLDMYATGAPVSYRPGTKLVTHPNTAKVYAVEPGGILRWVPDEATAVALYGSNWAQWVNDVHELTFGNYTIGPDMTSAAPSKGTLIEKTGDSTIYYFDGTNIRPFANSAAFDANNLNANFIVKVSSLGTWTVGSSVTGAEDFATISGVGVGTVTNNTPAGTLTVALSPNTPAANQILIGGAARVPMVTVRLTAGANPVTVDSFTVERDGVAQDGDFADFDLLRGDTMAPLNLNSKSLNANHQAIFNDDFTVDANSSMDVIVAANMASDLTNFAGEYPVISVAGITLKNNSTLSGTLPISGNVGLTNGTLTVGSVSIAAGPNNPSATTKEIGTKDYIVTSVKITNNSSNTNQNMVLKGLTITQNGSVAPSDVANVRLENGNLSTVLGTVASPTTKKITFSGLNVTINRGDTLNLNVRLDINSGSARDISYDIDQRADAVLWDTLRNANVLPSYPNASSPYFDANNTAVGNGKLRIESIAVTPTNIPQNKKKVQVGAFKFVMEGEAGDITSAGFKLSTTTGAGNGAFQNCQLIDPSGMTVAGPKDATLNSGGVNGATATTTDTITVPVGETIYGLYCDLDNNFATNNTVQASMFPGAITIKGDVSGNTITPTPAGEVQSTKLTIKKASLAVSLSTTPTAQSLVGGAQGVNVANVILDASNSGSDVRVTQFLVPIKTTGNAFPDVLTNIKLWVGTTQVPVDSNTISCASSCSTAATNGTTTLTISAGNLTIPAGQTKTVAISGDVGTGATPAAAFKVGTQGGAIVAIDSEAQSFTPSVTGNDGPNMALTTGGTLNITNATDPKAAAVVGGTTVDVAHFTAQALYDTINMKAFGITIGSPDGGIAATNVSDAISSLELWQEGGGSPLGTVTVNSTQATITPASPIALAMNASTNYIIKAHFANVDYLTSPALSGAGMKISISHVDSTGNAPGSGTITLNGNNNAFNTFSVFKSTPTVSILPLASNQITSNGSYDLFKFSIAPNSAGPIGVAKFVFDLNTSTVSVDPNGYTLLSSDSSSSFTDILANTNDFVVGGYADGVQHVKVTARFDVNNDDPTGHTTSATGENFYFSGTKYFLLRGSLSGHTGTSSDSESVQTKLAGDTGFVTSGTTERNVPGYDSADNMKNNFLWSDLNFSQNSTTATQYGTAATAGGWHNGFRVQGLDAPSSTPDTISG